MISGYVEQVVGSSGLPASPYSSSILHGVLQSRLPVSPSKIEYEAIGNMVAGTEASANVLLTISYFLVLHPTARERLYEELRPDPDLPDFKKLTTLPFLVRYPTRGWYWMLPNTII